MDKLRQDNNIFDDLKFMIRGLAYDLETCQSSWFT